MEIFTRHASPSNKIKRKNVPPALRHLFASPFVVTIRILPLYYPEVTQGLKSYENKSGSSLMYFDVQNGDLESPRPVSDLTTGVYQL